MNAFSHQASPMPAGQPPQPRILLGITGSIACYKAADLASRLRQVETVLWHGAQVDVVLTQSAQQFITPLTFQSVTGRPAYTDADLWSRSGHVLHIGLAEQADLVVIAPASANTLARLAHGIADNLLTIAALAARCPLVVAPAMDGGMYTHPATQANLEILRSRGVYVIGPAEGRFASGLSGIGRMVEPAELVGHIRALLGRHGFGRAALGLPVLGVLAGKKILVTAGGTQEAIDPVRVIANRSSGKQGFALAQAALDLGAQVVLVSGPSSLPTPVGAERVDVVSAVQMQAAVIQAAPQADALVMAAAVADFRPAHPAGEKIKKEASGEPPQIELVRNPDILKEVAALRSGPAAANLKVVVGFAAESQDLLANAAKKLAEKKLDLIAANDIRAEGAGFEGDTNRVTLLFMNGEVQPLPPPGEPPLTKFQVAGTIMKHVARLLGGSLKENEE